MEDDEVSKKPMALVMEEQQQQTLSSSPTAHNNNSHGDDDDIVPDSGAVVSSAMEETTSPHRHHHERKRRRRRRLQNHLRNQGMLFSNYLANDFDVPQNDQVIVIVDDDDDDEDSMNSKSDKTPLDDSIVVIDVDVQLGLKEEEEEENLEEDGKAEPQHVSSSSSPMSTMDGTEGIRRSGRCRRSTSTGISPSSRQQYHPTRQAKLAAAQASSHVHIHTEYDNDNTSNNTGDANHTMNKHRNNNHHHHRHSRDNTALSEGWYEGVVSPIALPEDALYLSAVHCFVRQHLEFFSATAASRRKQGRVGIRCIHCAKAIAATTSQQQSSSSSSWPTGALSYPNSFASVHQACAQRFQVHWQSTCPHMPPDVKAQFQFLVQQVQQPGRPTKRSRGGFSTPTYYTLSMQRIGLVETADGLRYSRDLKLQPLPLETVRATMEATTQQAATNNLGGNDSYYYVGNRDTTTIVSGKGGGAVAGVAVAQPTTTASSTAAMGMPAVSTEAAIKEARASIDEASEKVLAECIAEADQPEKYLARNSDKALLSDYIFVTIRQMALCHALPADLSSRGKKTKLMQVGFAGFCCRFCQNAAGGGSLVHVPSSCRSFLSAPDNLGSAITNSFTQHLQKCRHVPQSFQKAMVALKRIHQRQMALLPYGSQRRFFHFLWDRLRRADKTQEEMDALLPTIPQPPPPPPAPSVNVAMADTQKRHENGPTQNSSTVAAPDFVPPTRPADFPESNDEETRQVLQAAEASFAQGKDAAANQLLLLDERNLVSDYVFLTLMQLKPVAPNNTDYGRTRRPLNGGLMGVACIHCADFDQLVTPSGRSFPSAPDNFASAFNTSLYNHMQACGFLPPEVKHALVYLRKLHSVQCSTLRFGSQRKYFNRLFARLKNMLSDTGACNLPELTAEPRDTIESLGFLKINNSPGQPVHLCKHCRMVPAAFRARHAMCYDRLSLGRARLHRSICQEDGLDLSLTVGSFLALASAVEKEPDDLIQNAAFGRIVSVAVGGNEDLRRVFIDDVRKFLVQPNGFSSDHRQNVENQTKNYSGYWKMFPASVSFEDVDEAYQELKECLGISISLHEATALLDYLMVISPTFVVPSENQVLHTSNDGNSERSNGDKVLSKTELVEGNGTSIPVEEVKPQNGVSVDTA